ncbi:hypothetical protein Pgy4_37456, partial [Pseudomonas savastanoi pv. glycinea str. race 4]
ALPPGRADPESASRRPGCFRHIRGRLRAQLFIGIQGVEMLPVLMPVQVDQPPLVVR